MAWLTPEVFIAAATLATAILTYIRVNTLEKNTNNKMDELLIQKGLASEAKGNRAGRAEAREIDAKVGKS